MKKLIKKVLSAVVKREEKLLRQNSTKLSGRKWKTSDK
jgi:hypothetical protein